MGAAFCLSPRCPERAVYRGRCAGHARERETETHSDRAVYKTKRWRVLRRQRLYLDSLCPCGAIASEVDHILPISVGGAPYDLSNTRSLCKSCHSKATRQFMRTGRNEIPLQE